MHPDKNPTRQELGEKPAQRLPIHIFDAAPSFGLIAFNPCFFALRVEVFCLLRIAGD
jgi:hypothetical protein